MQSPDWRYLGRLNQAAKKAEIDTAEAAPAQPPPASAWRYRRTGAPRVFAQAGVGLGFLALVAPGVLALRSFRRWEAGAQATPAAAWRIAFLLTYTPIAAILFVTTRAADISIVVVSLVAIPVVLLTFGRG